MSVERYKINPFLGELIIPMTGQRVTISHLGRDENVLVNQATGEILGTHVTTYKKVDSAQFVKLFTSHIGMTFNLSSAGIKAFGVLMWAVQHQALSKDEVVLDSLTLEGFMEAHSKNEPPLKISIATMKRGIAELEKSKIIAKTMRKGFYFINPNFVFNGDRIAFTTLIEKKKENKNEQC